MRVRLIYHDIGGGLTRDAEIVSETLEAAGATVHRYRLDARNITQRVLNRVAKVTGLTLVDVNLFLENGLSPGLLDSARCNVLLPNPEWMDETTVAHIEQIDLITCKSRDAVGRLSGFGRPMAWVGFTARDRYRGEPARERSGALHVAGRSPYKGTGAVYEAWTRHPEWPALTIVAHQSLQADRGLQPAANIHVVGSIEDKQLLALQNRARLHLCPSESEGYGHTIAEAMSCGALVLSTNAPPMNEIVAADRGILVASGHSETLRHGIRHQVTPEAVERGVVAALALSPDAEVQMCRASRAWFIENERRFRRELPQVLAQALAQTRRAQAPAR